MGLSGGTTSKSYSESGSAQKWATPYAKEAAGQAAGIFNANQPALDEIVGNVRSLLPGLKAKFDAGNPNVRAAQGYNADVLAGKYLQNNPYLQDIINRTRQDVTNDVNSQFSSAGRYGSGAHTGVLTDMLANAEAGLRYQDYAGQQARMDQAAQTAPGLSAADYIGLPEYTQTAGVAAGLPYAGLDAYSAALAQLMNGGTSTSTQKTSGGILGPIASVAGAAIMRSDRRLKRDIEKVGELPDGLGVYEYDYIDPKWGEGRQRGVMADEVAALRPWALGPAVDGFATVDYSKLEVA